MLPRLSILAIGIVIGLASGVTAVYRYHPTLKPRPKCHHSLATIKKEVKNGRGVNMHWVVFRDSYDFFGESELPVTSEIFASVCNGDRIHADFATFYLKNGGVMSLNDVARLRTYAIKHNKKELEQLINDAIYPE
ncbi:MAG: hypothetical protein AAGC70_08765 [Pseudomonadota bacterium]